VAADRGIVEEERVTPRRPDEGPLRFRSGSRPVAGKTAAANRASQRLGKVTGTAEAARRLFTGPEQPEPEAGDRLDDQGLAVSVSRPVMARRARRSGGGREG